MAKSVTVTFQDGSSHTYDNVPDEITDDQVTQRAGSDFADKTITGVVGGIAPGAQEMGAIAPDEHSLPHKALAAVETAGHMLAEHPAVVGGAAGLWKANKVANAYIQAKDAEVAASQARTAQQAATAAGHQNIQQQKINLKAGVPAEPQILDAQGRPMAAPELPKSAMTNLPGMGAGPTVPEAPPSASNFMSRMTQLADQYLPAAKQAMGTAGRYVAPVARVLGSAPVMGAQLMAHSTPLGPQVPQTGPARGSELNPSTGRPWTAQELQAYNAQYR